MAKFTSEDEARELIINTAMNYVGVHEGSAQHHAIIDAYNSVTPRPRSYKVQYTDAWCATFVTFIFDMCGMSNLIERECGCQEMINKCAKRNLVVYKDLTSHMEIGNVVFYDWDSNGRSDHVGIIYKVTGSQLYVIEGNYQDEVRIRNIETNSKMISCIVTPYYDTTVLEPKDEQIEKGWHKDNTGWWYAYGTNKQDYYKNTFQYIDGQLFAFDSDGYICDSSSSSYDKDGAITYIGGRRL